MYLPVSRRMSAYLCVAKPGVGAVRTMESLAVSAGSGWTVLARMDSIFPAPFAQSNEQYRDNEDNDGQDNGERGAVADEVLLE